MNFNYIDFQHFSKLLFQKIEKIEEHLINAKFIKGVWYLITISK